jgi:hypothetical protein
MTELWFTDWQCAIPWLLLAIRAQFSEAQPPAVRCKKKKCAWANYSWRIVMKVCFAERTFSDMYFSPTRAPPPLLLMTITHKSLEWVGIVSLIEWLIYFSRCRNRRNLRAFLKNSGSAPPPPRDPSLTLFLCNVPHIKSERKGNAFLLPSMSLFVMDLSFTIGACYFCFHLGDIIVCWIRLNIGLHVIIAWLCSMYFVYIPEWFFKTRFTLSREKDNENIATYSTTCSILALVLDALRLCYLYQSICITIIFFLQTLCNHYCSFLF